MAHRIRGGGMLAAGVAVAALWATPAAADDDSALLGFGAGVFDVLHDHKAAEFRAEYRFGHGLFFLKPLVGGLVTTDGTTYGYGGLRADLILADHYVIMPNATLGYYNRGSSAKNLGSHLEFKTGAELAYRWSNAMRLGIAFDHISNAGITQVNPGTESIMLVYSLPIGGP